ncbi:MAG: hypothetical protein EPN49_04400 [Rhodanobacter sp.]|nr:MAG: hypothetical protein EPN49_04400 [Rhodanobacter sp.]
MSPRRRDSARAFSFPASASVFLPQDLVAGRIELWRETCLEELDGDHPATFCPAAHLNDASPGETGKTGQCRRPPASSPSMREPHAVRAFHGIACPQAPHAAEA